MFLELRNIRDFPCGPVVKDLLPVQETGIESMVWEDPTGCDTTGPTNCSY